MKLQKNAKTLCIETSKLQFVMFLQSALKIYINWYLLCICVFVQFYKQHQFINGEPINKITKLWHHAADWIKIIIVLVEYAAFQH